MNRKLIYISFGRLTDKISRDWYIDYSIEKGAVVEYWDIVSIMREEHDEKGALGSSYLRYVKSYRELDALLQATENQGAVYVMLLSYSGRFSKPYRLLSKYNCKMVFLSWGAMPINATAPKWKRMIYRFFTQPAKLVRAVSDTLLGIGYRKLDIVKRFDVVFAAGRALASVDQYAKKVVPFNLCDFDHYSRLKMSGERVVKGRYAVFLDINLPYQSDLAICGLPVISADSYFQSLNRFFALLEKTHGIKIVIASHPKAAYSSDEFEQRESHRMLTAELVKDAEYVVTHTSTALSYAILNLKPILFIYTDEMRRVYKNTVIREIECLALYLNVYVYNVDKITNSSQVVIQPPSCERYDSYKYNYLTSPESESMSSAEIFWREVSAI